MGGVLGAGLARMNAGVTLLAASDSRPEYGKIAN
jgi:hypothetical protein